MNNFIEKAVDGYITKSEIKNSDMIDELTFDENVKYICNEAYKNCNIQKIIVPKNVEVIDRNAFENCELLSEVIFEDEDIVLTKNVFKGCENLNKVILGSNEYHSYYVKSSKYGYYENQVMIIMDSIDDEEGHTLHILRDLYPTLGEGNVGGCYVLIDNASGEEIMITTQKSDINTIPEEQLDI